MGRRVRPAWLAAALLASWGADAATPDLSGPWYFDVQSPNGPGRRDVLVKQEGRRIIGFIDSDSASGRFVGTVDGREVEFTAVLEFGGQPMAAVYRARVEGDTMTGTIEYGLYGNATFTGHRGARPAAPAAAAALVGSARDATIEAARAGDDFGVLRGDLLLPEMLAVRGGRFRMGNDGPAVKPEYGRDYAHVHEVELSAFRLARFLVTNAQYRAYCRATGHAPPPDPRGWTGYGERYPNHPVVNVDYADASAYADWLSKVTGERYRLPTEAEWEYAARAGRDGDDFVFGRDWKFDGANTASWHIGRVPDRAGWKAWWDADGDRLSKSQPMTTRVGTFAANAWGFHDVTGNVWEWTNDWYGADYYARSPPKDPPGPATGTEKVLRGCSWYNQPDVCFLATRDRYAPESRLYYNGFRVAADQFQTPTTVPR